MKGVDILIFRDKELLDENMLPSARLLESCIKEHKKDIPRLKKLKDYYDGKMDILNRKKSNDSCANNKIVCNHAAYISDMAVGYVFGKPISYSGKNIEELVNHFIVEDEDSHNNELALDASIFGRAFELVYMDTDINNKLMPYLAVLSPFNTFVVYNTDIKKEPLFAVNYRELHDVDGNISNYNIIVYTDSLIVNYTTKTLESPLYNYAKEPELHDFGYIPIIEYKNNKNETGDFEKVISLIDAYNLLQSDRINDKEQLVDALLVITNQNLGDDEDEVSSTARMIKDNKILPLDGDADAKYLIKQLDETQVEVLKDAIKSDIHEFSLVPDLTDTNFVGNASGISLKYKLLGLEQLGNIKERFFKKGLRQRFAIIINIEAIRKNIINASDINIIMERNLPIDIDAKLNELVQTDNILSLKTRLQQYNPELDINYELKELEKEQKQKNKNMSDAFNPFISNEDQEDKTEDEDQEDK